MPYAGGFYYAVSEAPNTLRLPVILLHGAGSDHLCWPLEMRRLPGYRVLALDLPGHGRSQEITLHSVEEYALRVIEYMSVVGVYRAVLVGHSLGGAIALTAALRFSERVAAVGVISGGARLPLPKPLLSCLNDPKQIPQALAYLEAHLFAQSARRELIAKVMNGLRRVKPEVLVSDWRAAARFDLCEELHNIDQPVWVVTGTADSMTPPALAYYLQRHLRHVTVQIIPGAGHMVLLERPSALAESLLAFLDTLSFRLGGFR
jgi:pimeloyl-ACP methyl ester carboxylesterase